MVLHWFPAKGEKHVMNCILYITWCFKNKVFRSKVLVSADRVVVEEQRVQ